MTCGDSSKEPQIRRETGDLCSPPRQRQRHLRAEQLEQLKADYLAGVPVIDLAERYGIVRQTVIEHMRRLEAPRRYPKLSVGEAGQAADLYTTGHSLAAVGTAFGVDAGTVRRVLANAAVPIRDPHGRGR